MSRCTRVALMGLDGSGKSANIQKLKADKAFSSWKFVWVRWKPKLLGPAYQIFKRREEKAVGRENSQEALSIQYRKKKGLKKKLFRFAPIRGIWMGLALTDYLCQFYAKTFFSLIKGENMVFDRYYPDLFIDQGINFSYTPEKICREIRRFQGLFPSLNRIIYIRVRPEVCFQRKNDIPDREYLEKRFAVYERLKEEDGWVSVDGEAPLASVYGEVKKQVLGM